MTASHWRVRAFGYNAVAIKLAEHFPLRSIQYKSDKLALNLTAIGL